MHSPLVFDIPDLDTPVFDLFAPILEDAQPDFHRQTTPTRGTVSEASALYDAGMNVFPVPFASKKPYGRHGFLAAMRLYRDDLPALMAGSNMAVMTGRLSQNLFVLDCDTAEAFQNIGKKLTARSVRPWIRNSVRGGQYWMLCAAGEVANGKAGAVDILGNRTYTLAPPSVHPSGMEYAWEEREGKTPPRVTLAQVDFLPVRLENAASRTQPLNGSTVLPPVAYAVLSEHDTSAYGGDNSAAEYAACLSLLGKGYTEADMLRLFAMYEPPHYVKVGEATFKRAVLKKALAYHAQTSIAAASAPHSSLFRSWAEGTAWPGRTGHTDKAVYLALCHRMQCEGGMPFRASIREVAEYANVRSQTANKAIQRLIAAGCVCFHDIDAATGAHRYHLIQPAATGEKENVSVSLSPYGGVGEPTEPFTFPDHDVWNVNALGKSCLFVYRALRSDGMQTTKALTAATGKTLPTVRRALRTLARHALARQAGTHWAAVDTSGDALNRIALCYGTLGRTDRRTEQHLIQRQKRASALLREQIRRHTAASQNSAKSS